MGDQEGASWVTTRGERTVDRVSVLFVVAGDTAQVLPGEAGEACCFRQREPVVGGAEGSDVVGFDSGFACLGAPFELTGPNPPRPVGLDQRDQVGARRLIDHAAQPWAGRSNGRSNGVR